MNANTIKKIKCSKGYYILSINNNEYQINEWYYQCILPYEGKVLDVKTMIELIAFANASTTLKPLYKKIFTNSFSVYEFKGKLMSKDIDANHIDLIVSRFKEEGYLKDEEFVCKYKEIYEQNKGAKAFKQFLINKKIHSRLISEAMDEYVENEQWALEYATSFVSHKTQSTAMLKQKVKANLMNKGFSEDTIQYVLSEIVYEDEEAALIKEIKKYNKKYPNDYYKIISKLASKGYNLNKIKELLKKEGVNNEN